MFLISEMTIKISMVIVANKKFEFLRNNYQRLL